jgi:PhnB protein
MAGVELTPFLTVKDARGVADFYKKAFAAVERSRQSNPSGQFVIEMSIDGDPFYVVDENPAGFNLSPTTLGGTSVRMSLIVPDPDAVANRAVAAGATIIFPVSDHAYGMRQGRIADPAGHHWLIGKRLR